MPPLVVKYRNPCAYLPRRLQIVASLAVLLITAATLLISIPQFDEGSSLHDAQDRVQHAAHNIWNPFKAPVHTPPRQLNSSNDETSWFSDWKWHLPFSSSTTYEENRLVLPPQSQRVPVYTYYDSAETRNPQIKAAEHELLRIWRRAWWAKGFRPVVLGKAEAAQNPLYAGLHRVKAGKLEPDLMRWLAWGTMGTGVLANWLAVPMTAYDDPVLQFLRRGEYPKLTRIDGLQDGLFYGDKEAINDAIQTALSQETFTATNLISHLGKGVFEVDSDHEAFAYYSMPVLDKKYGEIARLLQSDLEDSKVKGMKALPNLINAHLHNTWQNVFSTGIAVVMPGLAHMTAAITHSTELARNLSQCSPSDLPVSCPPNRPNCRPCDSYHKLSLSMVKTVREVKQRFLVATVPHPYTYNALIHQENPIMVRYVRRKTKRDQYVNAIGYGLDRGGSNTFDQLVRLKENIASPDHQARSLWMTAERLTDDHWREDLAWIFGFTIPQGTVTGESSDPVPKLPGQTTEFDSPPGHIPPDEVSLAMEQKVLENSREIIRSKTFGRTSALIREAVEAWNLSDTELWRFVRAYNARRRMEREQWEGKERGFAGSEARAWGRWLDTASDDDSRM